jgi:dTDP-4-dehydrorhamnose reductase
MNVLILGAGGRTGTALIPMMLDETDASLTLVSRQAILSSDPRITSVEADITDRTTLKDIVMSTLPDAVINLAAMTNVDRCETDKNECWQLNVTLIENLTRFCRAADAHLVHVSTDYVFDGLRGPYVEQDTPNPLSYYGKSKLASENSVSSSGIDAAIVRTNVIYGPSPDHPDFVRFVLQSIDQDRPINAASDQYSNPTYVDDIADALIRIVRKRRTGMYHVGGRDYMSRYEFAVAIAETFKLPTTLINAVTTESLNLPARRPLRGGLISLKAEADLGMQMTGVTAGLVTLRHKLFQRASPAANKT